MLAKGHAMIRKSRFAHDWYPGDSEMLRSALKSYMGDAVSERRVRGIVAPHAGYVYSGAVAGETYARIHVPEVGVVVCVNHRAIGARAALMASGSWQTPLGLVPIQEDFCRELLKNVPLLEDDPAAHQREHSLELHLPFLQFRNHRIRLVPICLQHLTYADCEALGKGIAKTVKAFPQEVLLVASTDMTHFESQKVAGEQDSMAIASILSLDPKGLYEVVQRRRISMCGVIPTTSVLCACRELGATRGELVRYATSGDVSGDYSSIVGYAGVLIP
jgi:hypothetical protein